MSDRTATRTRPDYPARRRPGGPRTRASGRSSPRGRPRGAPAEAGITRPLIGERTVAALDDDEPVVAERGQERVRRTRDRRSDIQLRGGIDRGDRAAPGRDLAAQTRAVLRVARLPRDEDPAGPEQWQAELDQLAERGERTGRDGGPSAAMGGGRSQLLGADRGGLHAVGRADGVDHRAQEADLLRR